MKHPQLDYILKELRECMTETYRDRLIAIILFGSQARGDANTDSDIDLLVVLKDDIDSWTEIERTGHFLSPLCLKYNVVICNLFFPVSRFENKQTMLMKNIRKEGIYIYDKRTAISGAKITR